MLRINAIGETFEHLRPEWQVVAALEEGRQSPEWAGETFEIGGLHVEVAGKGCQPEPRTPRGVTGFEGRVERQKVSRHLVAGRYGYSQTGMN
ncbi:hypothetical protein D9M68_933110 [compost metagenome]